MTSGLMIETDIREKALRLLSLRAHSTEELRQKLSRKFPKDRAQIEEVIAELIELRLLDDKTFAESFVHYRQEMSPRGRFGLKIELQKKGIASEIISEVLEGISEEDELGYARKLVERKLKTFPKNIPPQKRKERLSRFLLAKGFSSAVVFKILKSSIQEQ